MKNQIRVKKTFSQGFTLIELLVVIAIIGLLSSTVLASLNSARGKARNSKVSAELDSINKAMIMMEIDTGEWPGHQTPYIVHIDDGSGNEIEDISNSNAGLSDTDGSYSGWDGPYIKEDIVDPWGTPYFFDTDYQVGVEEVVALGSYGPNGVGHNLYDADDIYIILAR